MDKIVIVTFTDPMMGLSYECKSIFRKLETNFADFAAKLAEEVNMMINFGRRYAQSSNYQKNIA